MRSLSWLWLVIVSQCTKDCVTTSTWKGGGTERETFEYLTDPCRYDKTSRAPSPPDVPLKVTLRTFIYYLRAFSNKNEMNMLILLELEWTDSRLKFSEVNPNITHIRGEKILFSDRMWLPHTYLTNEKTTEVMGNVQKDNFINIDPSGRIHFIGRLRSTLSCSPVNTEWFPFDKEECELLINSWHYDSRDVVMEWRKDRPVEYRSELSPVDYYLTSIESTSGLEAYVNANEDCTTSCKYNHSSLALTFKFARQSGFYLLDYYFPSIVLVSASWVTFWLDPDSTPGRAAVGSSTMLTFLMLGWTGSKIPNAPFKVNDIWELSCTGFILASLAEFALVNTTFRRESKKVELKKKTGKYILQYSVSPKKVAGRRMARRSSSVPSSPEIRRNFLGKYNKPKMKTIKELTDSEFRTNVTRRVEKLLAEEQSIPMIRLNRPSPEIVIEEDSEDENVIKPAKAIKPAKKPNEETSGFFTMTPQEIARWIDTQSRIVFPLAFLVFNLIYWNFLWIPQILGS